MKKIYLIALVAILSLVTVSYASSLVCNGEKCTKECAKKCEKNNKECCKKDAKSSCCKKDDKASCKKSCSKKEAHGKCCSKDKASTEEPVKSPEPATPAQEQVK